MITPQHAPRVFLMFRPRGVPHPKRAKRRGGKGRDHSERAVQKFPPHTVHLSGKGVANHTRNPQTPL